MSTTAHLELNCDPQRNSGLVDSQMSEADPDYEELRKFLFLSNSF